MIGILIGFVVGVVVGAIAGVIVYRRKVAVVEKALAQAKLDRDSAVKTIVDAKLVAMRAVSSVKAAL